MGNTNTIAELRVMMNELHIEVWILQLAMANNNARTHTFQMVRAFTRSIVPKPKPFNRARDAREIENFLFDMEQYFEATNVGNDTTKVTTATMYLTSNAKVWWRIQKAEIQVGNLQINT